MKKTLQQCLPNEFMGCEYDGTPAREHAGRVVVEVFDGRYTPWPGTHKNVLNWYQLENGTAVGWNENPARGWSFPVVKHNEAATGDLVCPRCGSGPALSSAHTLNAGDCCPWCRRAKLVPHKSK